MFQFLLQEGDSGSLQLRLEAAGAREQEAMRFLRIGEPQKAEDES